MTSTPHPRLDELRKKALSHLIRHIDHGDLIAAGRHIFDEALKASVAYHEQHPIEEDVGSPPSGGGALDIYHATLDKLRAEHRMQAMQPFIHKGVPLDLAGEIIDALVLAEQKTPAVQ